ncbi:MAG: L-threonylcarbamoyladenylate synthase [Enterovibrio sp.]
MSQFFIIHPENPQKRFINQAVDLIRQGGLVIYPTDSGYALGCQIANKSALERICQIRKLDEKHNFTLMCRDLSELSLYAKVDNGAFRIIRNNTPGRFTFILKATKEAPRRIVNDKRKTVGLRVPDNAIALALLEALGEPLLSTSLILPRQDVAESDPCEIQEKLNKMVDCIIHGGNLGQSPTTVIDLSEGNPVVIRQGSGDSSIFE